MEIEVFNETLEELEELPQLKEFLLQVAKDEGLDNIIYNVIIVDNEQIHEINREYRGIFIFQ